MSLGLWRRTSPLSFRITNKCILRCSRKTYSTAQATAGRKLRFRDLLKTPVFKSVLLTMLFGSTVIDFMKKRKEYEALISTYETRFDILNGIIAKLKKGETVDLNQELNIANSLTRHKYNTVTDVELDEQLNEFLKLAEEKEKNPKEELHREEPTNPQEPTRPDPKKFL